MEVVVRRGERRLGVKLRRGRKTSEVSQGRRRSVGVGKRALVRRAEGREKRRKDISFTSPCELLNTLL
jgi:hypothetical protein